MRERMRIGDIANKSNASSFNQSCDAGAGSLSSSSRVAVSGRIYERALQPHLQPGPHSARRAQLRKQRTSESAPHQSGAGPGAVGSNVPGFGGSSRHLPRQQSNASAYSAVIPTSYSHQGITLVRGASCSLVDIPTYLGPSAGVELGLMCDHAPNSTTAAAGLPPTLQTKPGGSGMSHLGHSISSTDGHRSKRERPRLQLDLTRKKNAKSARKTQWTVLCVSLTLLTLAVTLVGTMLSVGSQYQERVISRQWHEITKNHTRGVKKKTAVTLVEEEELEEPFVIVPNDLAGDIDEESGTGYGKNNSTAGDKPEGGKSEGGRKEEKEIIPILFPETADTRDLFGIDNDRPVVVVKRRRRKKRTGIAIP